MTSQISIKNALIAIKGAVTAAENSAWDAKFDVATANARKDFDKMHNTRIGWGVRVKVFWSYVPPDEHRDIEFRGSCDDFTSIGPDTVHLFHALPMTYSLDTLPSILVDLRTTIRTKTEFDIEIYLVFIDPKTPPQTSLPSIICLDKAMAHMTIELEVPSDKLLTRDTSFFLRSFPTITPETFKKYEKYNQLRERAEELI
tara:strand:- start:124 stop:723 length:600 start_codon:yes stop_codon:yes gene_type:complete